MSQFQREGDQLQKKTEQSQFSANEEALALAKATDELIEKALANCGCGVCKQKYEQGEALCCQDGSHSCKRV